MNKDIFIFIGPPGAGKGSLAALCVKKFGWVPLSTGNLCRKHIFEQTLLGKQVESAIKAGQLVDDSLISAMVEQWLIEMRTDDRALILDGYPRSLEQVRSFERILKEYCDGCRLHVVLFSIPVVTLIARLKSRLMCQNKDCQTVYSSVAGSGQASMSMLMCEKCGSPLGRRDDDKEEAVVARLASYPAHTAPLIQFYRDAGCSIIELDADAPLIDVFEEFMCKVAIRTAV